MVHGESFWFNNIDSDKDLTGLVVHPRFSKLLHYCAVSPLIKRESDSSEFQNKYVPSEYDPEIVWDLLMYLRRSQAFHSSSVSVIQGNIRPNWHTLPNSLALTLRLIAEKTRHGSPLDSIVTERNNERFITQQYVQELQTCLRLDGQPAEYEDIRSVLLRERPPLDEAETLACNYHRIMAEMADTMPSQITKALITSIFLKLCEGVSLESPLADPHSPLEPIYKPLSSILQEPDPHAIDIIEAVSSDLLSEKEQHPIMVSFLINCQFWRLPVFPRYNNLMGCLISRLYLCKKGYPVLRYVPKIRILEEWKQGANISSIPYSFAEIPTYWHSSCDWTPYYDVVMKLLLQHIESMEASLLKRKSIDDIALIGIEKVPYLTYRQQELLKRAVLKPNTQFHISEHQREFGCAYSTARVDLEKLVELGFFIRTAQGTQHHYQAVEDLKSRLAKL